MWPTLAFIASESNVLMSDNQISCYEYAVFRNKEQKSEI